MTTVNSPGVAVGAAAAADSPAGGLLVSEPVVDEPGTSEPVVGELEALFSLDIGLDTLSDTLPDASPDDCVAGSGIAAVVGVG